MAVARPPWSPALVALFAGCPAPDADGPDTDVGDTEPVDSERPAGAAWASTSAVDAGLDTPFASFDVVAAGCADPTVILTVADGAEQRVLSLTPEVDGDTLKVTAPVDALLPEGATCALDRTLSVTAEVRCGDEIRPVDDARPLTVGVDAATVDGLTGPVRLFHRRPISMAYDERIWATDGRTVVGTTPPGSDAPRRVTVSGVDVSGAPLLRVRGDHHDFLAVRCTSRCPELSLSGLAAAPGVVPTVPSAWVLAIPLDAPDGALDAVARVAVPAGILDLAFHDGTLTVLSQVGARALLARFPEKETLPTSEPLDASVSVLPEPVGVAFQRGPEGDPLVVLRTSPDPTTAQPVFWDAIQQETIPVPTPTGGGGCANPGGTVIVSPSPTSSSSIPASSGNEAGTLSGTASGTNPPDGCLKSWSVIVKPTTLRASTGGSVATVAIDDWTTEVAVPDELVGGAVVDGVGARDQLVVAIGAEDGRAGLLRADLVGRTASWLAFPGDAPDRPSHLVPLRHLATHADGAGLVVTTATGFHVFDGDGAWVAGTEGLSQACVSLETPEAVAAAADALLVVLRPGPVVVPVP